jgi:hypothetical protein
MGHILLQHSWQADTATTLLLLLLLLLSHQQSCQALLVEDDPQGVTIIGCSFPACRPSCACVCC